MWRRYSLLRPQSCSAVCSESSLPFAALGLGGGGAGRGGASHKSSLVAPPPPFSPPLPRFRLILLTASLSLSLCAASSSSLHRRSYLQDGAVRPPSKVPVSPSEAAQVQGVDGHVGGGLPCRAGAVAGPGVLVDDHLRREPGVGGVGVGCKSARVNHTG